MWWLGSRLPLSMSSASIDIGPRSRSWVTEPRRSTHPAGRRVSSSHSETDKLILSYSATLLAQVLFNPKVYNWPIITKQKMNRFFLSYWLWSQFIDYNNEQPQDFGDTDRVGRLCPGHIEQPQCCIVTESHVSPSPVWTLASVQRVILWARARDQWPASPAPGPCTQVHIIIINIIIIINFISPSKVSSSVF